MSLVAREPRGELERAGLASGASWDGRGRCDRGRRRAGAGSRLEVDARVEPDAVGGEPAGEAEGHVEASGRAKEDEDEEAGERADPAFLRAPSESRLALASTAQRTAASLRPNSPSSPSPGSSRPPASSACHQATAPATARALDHPSTAADLSEPRRPASSITLSSRSSPTMSSSAAKGDYQIVVDQDQDPALAPSRTGSFSASPAVNRLASPPPSPLDAALNHPALPVLCYCASSILMTVRSRSLCIRRTPVPS